MDDSPDISAQNNQDSAFVDAVKRAREVNIILLIILTAEKTTEIRLSLWSFSCSRQCDKPHVLCVAHTKTRRDWTPSCVCLPGLVAQRHVFPPELRRRLVFHSQPSHRYRKADLAITNKLKEKPLTVAI